MKLREIPTIERVKIGIGLFSAGLLVGLTLYIRSGQQEVLTAKGLDAAEGRLLTAVRAERDESLLKLRAEVRAEHDTVLNEQHRQDTKAEKVEAEANQRTSAIEHKVVDGEKRTTNLEIEQKHLKTAVKPFIDHPKSAAKITKIIEEHPGILVPTPTPHRCGLFNMFQCDSTEK